MNNFFAVNLNRCALCNGELLERMERLSFDKTQIQIKVCLLAEFKGILRADVVDVFCDLFPVKRQF